MSHLSPRAHALSIAYLKLQEAIHAMNEVGKQSGIVGVGLISLSQPLIDIQKRVVKSLHEETKQNG